MRKTLDYVIALAAALLTASIVLATDPSSIKRAEAAFAMTSLPAQPCTLCDNCQCKACDCHELEARLAKPPRVPAPPAVKVPPVVKAPVVTQTIAHVAASNHSHACPNPDCKFRRVFGEPYVWGGRNHGHVCPFCNTQQTVVSGKPVTVPVTRVQNTAPVIALQPQTYSLTSLQGAAMMSSACASGSCATASSAPRRGFFRRL